MSEVFDTYSRKPTIYYIFSRIILLPLILLFIGWWIDLKISSEYYPYFISLLVLGLIGTIVGIILPATNLVKMYIVDGQLILSPESVIVRSTILSSKNIKKIEIKAYSYVGSRSIDGSGNTIEITTKSNEIVGCRFVIKSKDQREKLYLIIQQWASDSIDVNL